MYFTCERYNLQRYGYWGNCIRHESERWGFESPSDRDIFCLKIFDTFKRTAVRVSKMNAVARAQLTIQILTFATYNKISLVKETSSSFQLWNTKLSQQSSSPARIIWISNEGVMHYDNVIMSAMASQTTGLTMFCSNVYSDAHQMKHQSSSLLAFMPGLHRWPVISSHKGPVTQIKVSIWWRHYGKIQCESGGSSTYALHIM